MKGLLLKDIYNLSGQLKIYACFPFLAAFLAYQSEDWNMIMFACSFFAMFIVITSCAYDEIADFDAYALTLPLSRRDLVISKYVLSALSCLAGAGVSILVSAVMLQLFPDRFAPVDWQDYGIGIIITILVINMLLGIFLPMVFRFGTEKARILLIILFLAMGCLLYAVSYLDLSWVYGGWLSLWEQYAVYIIAAAAILVEAISLSVSVRILAKKEF